MFSNNQHQPHSEADFFSHPSQETSNRLQSIRHLAEFGFYLSCGLTIAFLSRLTGALVFYFILFVSTLLWVIWVFGRRNRTESLAVGIALSASILAGFWDALYLGTVALFLIIPKITWVILTFLVVFFGMLFLTRRHP